MSDQRESFGKRRKSANPQLRKIEPIEEQPNLDKAIQVVSGLLSSKKAVLARPPTQPPLPLPDLSGSLGDRLKNPPELRAKVATPDMLVDAPPLEFPEAKEADRSIESSAGSDFVPQSVTDRGAPVVSQEISPARVGSAVESDRGFPRASLNLVNGEASGSQLAVSISHSVENAGSLENSGRGGSAIDRNAGAGDETAPRSDSTRSDVGEGAGLPAATVSVAGASALDRLHGTERSKSSGELRAYEEGGTTRSSPAYREGVQPGLARSPEARVSSIRNPFSGDLRSFSMTNSTALETGATTSGSGGLATSESEPSVGSSPSLSEGGSIDLSRTNELLQQLVDAVRKQRGSSLLVGGPPVYSDR